MAGRTELQMKALTDVYDAAGRLAERGLAVNDDGNHGVTGEGFSTFGDLASVLMLQGMNGSDADQVMSATCRALIASLSAVAADAGGDELQARMQMTEAAGLLNEAAALARMLGS